MKRAKEQGTTETAAEEGMIWSREREGHIE
jgi:hypothetical protein